MIWIRIFFSSIAALALTSALFFFLHAMVGVHVDAAKLKPAARIEFTRLRKDSAVQSRREVKPRLDLPVQAPAGPMVATAGAGVGSGEVVSGVTATAGRIPGVGFGVSGTGVAVQKIAVRTGGSDRDALPLVRIEPEYPVRAAQRGIEGWVLLRYNITAIGTVKDVVVVESEPHSIFDQAAIRAVSGWKYNPKIEEGVAVERRGVQVVLRFALEKNKN